MEISVEVDPVVKAHDQVQHRVVLIGYGNPARGDDGLGLALLSQLREKLGNTSGNFHCRYVEAFQLNPEHAFDLLDCDIAIFLDADSRAEQLSLSEVFPDSHYQFSSHSQSPGAVLQLYRQLPDSQGRHQPHSFLLGIGAQTFGLGESISRKGQANLAWAAELLPQMLLSVEPDQWLGWFSAQPFQDLREAQVLNNA